MSGNSFPTRAWAASTLHIQSAHAEPGALHSPNRGSDFHHCALLTFSRSCLTCRGSRVREGKEVVKKSSVELQTQKVWQEQQQSLTLAYSESEQSGGRTSSQLPSLFSLLQVKGLMTAECGQERGKEGASMWTLMSQYK